MSVGVLLELAVIVGVFVSVLVGACVAVGVDVCVVVGVVGVGVNVDVILAVGDECSRVLAGGVDISVSQADMENAKKIATSDLMKTLLRFFITMVSIPMS